VGKELLMEGAKPSFEELFEQVITYPDFEYQERLNELVGIDEHKDQLIKILSLLVNPSGIKEWANKHHKGANKVINFVLKRPPLVVLEGDVGSGKSELATTIGDAVARQEKIEISLLPLSLSTRGEGRVGQMTKLISAAFDYTIERAEKLKNSSGGSRGAVILLVDEADALTQSRENAQMHHEDRAGVNAFIRGVDRIGNGKLPAAVIMCTNRLSALDPAVKRRAADILKFGRPNEEQRLAVLKESFQELGLSEKQLKKVVSATGGNSNREYGFTFSDLTQRLLPAIVLDAYPNTPVTEEIILKIVTKIEPTPPFQNKPDTHE
jgi:AAA+ superfamily predicted ATPase